MKYLLVCLIAHSFSLLASGDFGLPLPPPLYPAEWVASDYYSHEFRRAGASKLHVAVTQFSPFWEKGTTAITESIQAIIEEGADIHARDKYGVTAYEYALEWCNYSSAKILSEKDAHVEMSWKTICSHSYGPPELRRNKELVSDNRANLKRMGVHLKSNGFALDTLLPNGNTPLEDAIVTCNVAKALLFIGLGAKGASDSLYCEGKPDDKETIELALLRDGRTGFHISFSPQPPSVSSHRPLKLWLRFSFLVFHWFA